jgi:hypothetical protein
MLENVITVTLTREQAHALAFHARAYDWASAEQRNLVSLATLAVESAIEENDREVV